MKVSLITCCLFGMEVLTEICRSSSFHNLALLERVSKGIMTSTRIQRLYLRPALEDDRLVARTFGVSESAYCLCSFVFKPSKKFVELLYA